MCGGKKKNRSSELSPCLVYTHSHKKKDHLIFCSLSSNPQAIYRKPIPKSIGDSCIVSYSCGWFLLSQDNHTYLTLWNNKFSFFHDSHDSDDSFIHLPPLFLKPTQKISHFSLSSSPDEDPDNSMVLLFENTLRSLIFIRPSHENSRWIEIPYGDLVRDSLHGCVSCNGKLYSFTSKGDKLVRLEVDKQDHLSIQELCSLPERKTMNTVGLSLKITYMNNLIECCGELLNVYIVVVKSKAKQATVTEVCVLKLDFDTMIWERANNLMGHAVFFNALGDSWCPVFGKGIIEADSIYFTLPNDQSLYSFNVKDDCLSVSLLQCPKLPKSSSCSSPKILVPHRLIRLFRYTQENQVQEIDEKEDTTKTKIQTVRETSFSDLPLDCVMEITDGLNLFEYWNLRAVCRDWRFVLPKLSRKETLQRFTTFHSSSSMWLLFLTNNMTALKFIDPIHGTSFLMNLPESLKGSVVRCSSNGWLLMCDEISSMSFFNPFTEEIIKLQDTPTQVCALSCVMAFSHTPTSPYCKVVGCGAFRPPSNTTSHLHTLVADIRLDNQWEYAYKEYGSVFWLNNTSPLYFGGAFFLLGQNGKLSFLHYNMQPQIRELSWVVLNEPRAPCKYFHRSFLVEFHGHIVSIFVGHMGKWLKAFRLDFTEMRWEELESIGNNVIYVSQSSCVCKEARIAGTENRIYFPRFHGNSILYYSFGTREFHVDGEGIVERFYNTMEPLMATWIEPTY